MRYPLITRAPRGRLALTLLAIALGLTTLLAACGGPASAFYRPAPLAADAIVAYTSEDGRGGTVLDGLRGRDGTVAWSTPIGQSANEPPLVFGGVIYAEAGDHIQPTSASATPSDAVVAVRLRDGHPLWRATLPASSLQLAADATSIIVAAGDAGLYALDPASGAVRWHQTLRTRLAPFVGGGVVVVQVDDIVVGKDGPPIAAPDSGLWGFRERDGAVLWTRGQLAAAAADQVAVYGNIGGAVTARRLVDDHVLWEYDGAPPVSGVAAQTFLMDRGIGGQLALVVTGGHLVALDARTGQFRWQSSDTLTDTPGGFVAIGGPVFGPVFGAGSGSVPSIVVAHHGTVIALQASDGAVLWRTVIPDYHDGTVLGMSGQEGALFVEVEGPACKSTFFGESCLPNRLAALDTSTGAIAWWHDLPSGLMLARAAASSALSSPMASSSRQAL
jgi:outer membrane protein assembly factor BamB